MVAVTTPNQKSSSEASYLATIAFRIFQRSTHPPLSARIENLLKEGGLWGELSQPLSVNEAFEALNFTKKWKLEQSIELHAKFEAPFLRLVSKLRPDLTKWLTPQISLDALVGGNDQGNRWVDFLLAVPGARPTVIEIDGSGHGHQIGVDQQRDRTLRRVGFGVERLDGASAINEEIVDQLLEKLQPTPEKRGEFEDLISRSRRILGPAAIHRFGVAIAELLQHGFLNDGPWNFEVTDDLEVIESCAGGVFDLLFSIDALWGLKIVPSTIVVNKVGWKHDGERYQRLPKQVENWDPTVAIIVDPFRPSHAALPDPNLPTVVIRHLLLPADLAWRNGESTERRTLATPGLSSLAIEQLAADIFDKPSLRSGQLAAISQALAGADGLIMLPTGTGKSLIYWLAGLLRPGTALVIDPLQSLIDDQTERLQQDGISRALPLHSGRGLTRNDYELFLEAMVSGEYFFVFMTPESMQKQDMRDALGAASESSLINLTVVDEAHCVSEWGHDFRTSYLRIGRNLRRLTQGLDGVSAPVLALTGTASKRVVDDIVRELELDRTIPGTVQRPASFDRPNLKYDIIKVAAPTFNEGIGEVLRANLPLRLNTTPEELFGLAGEKTKSGIIFTPHTNGDFGVLETREAVKTAISSFGITPSVGIYSGGSPRGFADSEWAKQRKVEAARFKDNETQTLVSTKAFGMGIDKPNIRFTVHAGLPSSIESFAQEAGRAGRDGAESWCFLLANLPTSSDMHSMMDQNVGHARLRERFEASRASSDIKRQLFFFFNSFSGQEDEAKVAIDVFRNLDEVATFGGHADLAFPEVIGSNGEILRRESELERSKFEKALHRLSSLGIVDDYVIDYGAKSFTVFRDYIDVEKLDAALLAFADRVDPGRHVERMERLESSPVELGDRIEHHIRLLLQILYRSIAPGRLAALNEMYLLAEGASGDAEIRSRINAYLGQGLIGSVLGEIINRPGRIDVAGVLEALGDIEPEDRYEWAGATARQLEATPNHPIALFVAALAQCLLPNCDRNRVTELLELMTSAVEDFGISSDEAGALSNFAILFLHQKIKGVASAHSLYFWSKVVENDWTCEDLESTEAWLLANPSTTGIGELDAIVYRRMTRINNRSF